MAATGDNLDTGSKPADPYTTKAKEDVPLKDKIVELSKFMEDCKFAMMTTHEADSGLMTSRAMALAATEGHGIDLLFHTNTASGKTSSLASDPSINIAFLSASGQWASVAGAAEVSTDRELVRKYYSPALKAWLGDLEDGTHDGGPEDPRIGIIRVTTKQVTYALSSRGVIGQTIEFAKGMVSGETPSFMRLKEITEEQCEMVRKGSL